MCNATVPGPAACRPIISRPGHATWVICENLTPSALTSDSPRPLCVEPTSEQGSETRLGITGYFNSHGQRCPWPVRQVFEFKTFVVPVESTPESLDHSPDALRNPDLSLGCRRRSPARVDRRMGTEESVKPLLRSHPDSQSLVIR